MASGTMHATGDVAEREVPMTPDERVAKCLGLCLEGAKAKVQEKRDGDVKLVQHFPLYRSMVSTPNAFPDLYTPKKDN